MKKRIYLVIMLVVLLGALSSQSYYNLRYTWQEIEDAITSVRDTLPARIDEKLDSRVGGIRINRNAGVPILVDMEVDDGAAGSDYGYIFAVDGVAVLRVAAHSPDGFTTDSYSLTIGPETAEPGYALTVAGAAIASRWDVAGGDFAEYFETQGPLDVGVSVVFGEGGLIREAGPGEKPFGITSQGAGFIGNTGRPAQKYMTTAFGETVFVAVEYVQVEYSSHQGLSGKEETIQAWVPAGKLDEIPEGAAREMRLEPVVNPEFGKAHVHHRNRADMALVGIVGQIPLRKGQATSESWFFIKDLDEETELWLVK